MEPQTECMPAPISTTPEGKKELPGFQVGMRESAPSFHRIDLNDSGRLETGWRGVTPAGHPRSFRGARLWRDDFCLGTRCVHAGIIRLDRERRQFGGRFLVAAGPGCRHPAVVDRTSSEQRPWRPIRIAAMMDIMPQSQFDQS
jgi:hypothetical protein